MTERCSLQWVTLYNVADVLVDTQATVFKMLVYSFSLNECSYKEMRPGIGGNMLCAVGDFVSGFTLETYFQMVHSRIGRYETPG